MNKLMLKIRAYRTSPAGQIILGISQFLPYIVIVITLKTVLIFMVLNSFSSKNNDQMNSAQFSDYGVNFQDTGRELSKSPHDSEKLFEGLLIPSHENRTPEGTMWLFFNRIPRTGGQTIVSLLKSLSMDRDLQHQEHEYKTPWQRLMRRDEQKNLAMWFEYNTWPTSYDRFALYVNFEDFLSDYAQSKPAYFTMVRNPVEKFISYYRSKRIDSKTSKLEMSLKERLKPGSGRKWYWRTVDECVLEEDEECSFREGKNDFLSAIPYLCGQEEECLEFGSKGALQMAKFHAEYDYSVVGLVEDLNMTLSVLEEYLPLFFTGAFNRYWDKDFEHKEKRNPKNYKNPSEKVIQILKDKFALEFELYEFLRQRLVKQFLQIDPELTFKKPLIKKAAIKSLSPLDRFQIELRHLEKNRDEFQRLNKMGEENKGDAIEVVQEDPDVMPVLDAHGNIPGYNVLIDQ